MLKADEICVIVSYCEFYRVIKKKILGEVNTGRIFCSVAAHTESSEFPSTQSQAPPIVGIEGSPHKCGLHYK